MIAMNFEFTATMIVFGFPSSGDLLPSALKPRMSCPTELVRPESASCLCRNSFIRARPLPLSSSPWVNTPSSVDLPASTFPNTAILRTQKKLSVKNYNQPTKRQEKFEKKFGKKIEKKIWKFLKIFLKYQSKDVIIPDFQKIFLLLPPPDQIGVYDAAVAFSLTKKCTRGAHSRRRADQQQRLECLRHFRFGKSIRAAWKTVTNKFVNYRQKSMQLNEQDIDFHQLIRSSLHIKKLIKQSINQWTNQPTNQSINQSVDHSFNQSINQSFEQSIPN